MSDSPTNTPTKPKPGSLRDRIAAFENKATANASPERPLPPRTKPAGFATWKPRPPSPPESSTISTTSGDVGGTASGNNTGGGEGVVRAGHGGMNAADAKDSITRTGGSLKERMAALQGRGAFGAPAPPPIAPRPASENRPKWKPPPQLVLQPDVGEEGGIKDHPKEDSDEKEQSEIVKSNPPSIKSPPPIARSPPSTFDNGTTGIAGGAEGAQATVDTTTGASAEGEQTQIDEGEEERQRRVAIAARMAKLGGARIGMGPPVFGRPVVPPPSKKPSLPVSVPEAEVEPPKVMEEEPIETPPDLSPRQPALMPVPTIPKRAAPPRRKPAKQTSTGAVISPETSPIPPPGEVPAALSLAEESAAPSVAAGDVIDESEHRPEEKLVEEPESIDEPDTMAQPESVPQIEKVMREVRATSEEADQEDEEEARKKRVAEKLAKMGGVNPFALTPLRKPSVGSTASAEGVLTSPPTSPPIPARKPSLGSPRPIPADKPAISKRASGSSVKSVDVPFIGGAGVTRRTSLGSVAPVSSTGDVVVGRRASVGSVRSAKKVEEAQEVQEITEEPEEMISEGGDSTFVPYAREAIESKDEKDEIDEHDVQEELPHDEGLRSHHYDDEDTAELDFDATPQPPLRIPQIASSVSRGQGNQVDPIIVASAIPPPPSRSPSSTTAATHIETSSASVVPTPLTIDASRDHSADRDRLSGPAPPRRVVPQTPEPPTPEQETQDLDNEHNQSGIDTEAKESDDDAESELARSTLFVPPPASAGTPYRTVFSAEMDEGEESELPLHVPPPSSIDGAGGRQGERSMYGNIDAEPNTSGVPLPVRVNVSPGGDLNLVEKTRPSRTVPPPPLPIHSIPSPSSVIAEEFGSDYGDDRDDEHGHGQEQTDESEEQVLRTRPLSDEHSQSLSISSSAADLAENIPLIVPPRLAEGGGVRHAPIRSVPPPPGPPGPPTSAPEEEEREVLDEDEGDPIDPSFHSPSRRGSLVPGDEFEQTITHVQGQGQGSLTPSLSPSTAVRSPPPILSGGLKEKYTEDVNAEEAEAEKERRQTIAERMARLGGIKFGSGTGIAGRPPVPMRKNTFGAEEDVETRGEERGNQQEKSINVTQESASGEDEEEERARRERIAAKLAGMGGMRIGMMPMAVPPRQSHVLKDVPPTPPPNVPQPTTRGSEASESGASEDGVKVEAEESEIEEVGYEEAKGGSEEGSGEEVPPPPPIRSPDWRDTTSTTSGKAHTVLSPTSPSVSVPRTPRTPVPVPGPFRRMSTQSTGSSKKTPQSIQAQPAEYVLVDDPEVIGEETEDEVVARADAVPPPPPPPARSVHRALPPAPLASLGDSISSQWELPAIPTSSFGGDLSASWSEAILDERQAQSSQGVSVAVSPPAAVVSPRSPEALHYEPDDLMAIWGRVGVQICEASTRLYDHAKKNLVGDGTFRGFVDAVLKEVPNASKPQLKQIPYGYLVYLQNGAQVQKRASEIMPGDIAEIVDARFKGHKGLGGYQQHVGTGVEGSNEGGGPVIGIVCEFEMKKSKLKLFQANQHVGKQTVEVGSYRLEDLKSGLIKVYRVLEA